MFLIMIPAATSCF